MFKRILLAVTFVAALAGASLVAGSKASAHDYGCGYGYRHYGYLGTYYPVYSSYYGYGYGPRVAVYPPIYPAYYRGYYGGHHRHHHHHDGITVSLGF